MSPNFSFWQLAYQQGWATMNDLQQVVVTPTNPYGEITPTEYYTITKDTTYLKTLVVNVALTADQYQTITGQVYTP